ncbi:MAG: hypothetical protein M3065_13015 [Actinomycetota bacterium]|nr:hypothetical protein [Actinomycetota bacterium]
MPEGAARERSATAQRRRADRGIDAETRGAETNAHAEREAEDARRAEREAEREARERATVFNGDLGRAMYSSLSRVKVDERTLKILASVNVTGELGDLAMRGARYCLPGWAQETTLRNGKTKYVYIDQRAEGEGRASEYLAGATKTGEPAGRSRLSRLRCTPTSRPSRRPTAATTTSAAPVRGPLRSAQGAP